MSHLDCLSSLHFETTNGKINSLMSADLKGCTDLKWLCKELVEIKLPELQFAATDLAFFQVLTKLKILDLSHTKTTTESLIHLR